jgi:dTDP-4-amino-4,6-dideoxygalactose transaminase
MARIHLSPPDVGPLEREYLLRAFDDGWIAPVGPDLDAFEAEASALTGWPGAVALASGTAALHGSLSRTDAGDCPGWAGGGPCMMFGPERKRGSRL